MTEVYQFETTARSVLPSDLGYFLSIGTTLVGFYFLWRGLYEWNRLTPRPVRVRRQGAPWVGLSMLIAGFAAAALLDVALGSVGNSDVPPPLAWLVVGTMVLAIGSFFLTLRKMVAPLQGPAARGLGWAAFVWALGVSVVSGLSLGHVIGELFVDFFTNWSALILNLGPFIFAVSPLFVAFGSLSVGYAVAYAHASRTPARSPMITGSAGP